MLLEMKVQTEFFYTDKVVLKTMGFSLLGPQDELLGTPTRQFSSCCLPKPATLPDATSQITSSHDSSRGEPTSMVALVAKLL